MLCLHYNQQHQFEILDFNNAPLFQPVPKLSEIRGKNRAKQVVQAFRAYKRKEFKPNPKVRCSTLFMLSHNFDWKGRKKHRLFLALYSLRVQNRGLKYHSFHLFIHTLYNMFSTSSI